MLGDRYGKAHIAESCAAGKGWVAAQKEGSGRGLLRVNRVALRMSALRAKPTWSCARATRWAKISRRGHIVGNRKVGVMPPCALMHDGRHAPGQLSRGEQRVSYLAPYQARDH